MPTIHPSAILEGDVDLAPDVFIGPWCCLKGPIRIGAGTRLLRRVELYGPLTLGAANLLYPGVCLGFAPQDRGFDSDTPGAGVAVGDHNVFREFVTVHRATRATPTTIGSHVYLMANAHVGHDGRVDDHATLANSALLGGHVHVAARAFIGGNGAVHQFCRVGELAMLAGGIVIARDLPPYCTSMYSKQVNALNLVGLRRAGLRASIAPLQRAFDLFFRQRHTNPVGCALIEQELGHDPCCRHLVEFIRATHRGISHYHSSEEKE